MKRFLLTLLLIPAVVGLDANIDPSDPGDIVLNGSNSYSVTKTFDGSRSTGTIKKYKWDVLKTGQSATGIEVNLTFDAITPQTKTIRLTVSNGTASNVSEVEQTVHDIPQVTISASSTSVNTGDTVTFNSTVNDTFDSVNYSWTVDGSEVSTESDFATSFSNTGDKSVSLAVTDSYDQDTVTETLTVSVSTSSSDTGGESSGGGGGGGFPAILSEDDSNDTNSEAPEEDTEAEETEPSPQPVSVDQTTRSALQTAANTTGITVTEKKENTASQNIGDTTVSVTTITYEINGDNYQGPVTRLTIPLADTDADTVTVTVPKDVVSTTERIHGEFETVKRDPIVQLSGAESSIYLPGGASVVERLEFSPLQDEDNETRPVNETKTERPSSETTETGNAIFIFALAAIAFLALIAAIIYKIEQ